MRWSNAVAVLALVSTTLVAAEEKVRDFRFAKDDVGKLPAGWKAERTGKGEGSVWKVMADETAPSKTSYVLAQTAEDRRIRIVPVDGHEEPGEDRDHPLLLDGLVLNVVDLTHRHSPPFYRSPERRRRSSLTVLPRLDVLADP